MGWHHPEWGPRQEDYRFCGPRLALRSGAAASTFRIQPTNAYSTSSCLGNGPASDAVLGPEGQPCRRCLWEIFGLVPAERVTHKIIAPVTTIFPMRRNLFFQTTNIRNMSSNPDLFHTLRPQLSWIIGWTLIHFKPISQSFHILELEFDTHL